MESRAVGTHGVDSGVPSADISGRGVAMREAPCRSRSVPVCVCVCEEARRPRRTPSFHCDSSVRSVGLEWTGPSAASIAGAAAGAWPSDVTTPGIPENALLVPPRWSKWPVEPAEPLQTLLFGSTNVSCGRPSGSCAAGPGQGRLTPGDAELPRLATVLTARSWGVAHVLLALEMMSPPKRELFRCRSISISTAIACATSLSFTAVLASCSC